MSAITVYVCDNCKRRRDGQHEIGYSRMQKPSNWWYIDGADCCSEECVKEFMLKHDKTPDRRA